MKQFISFIRKEFFHIFRDRRTMLILLGMPIVQIILFGFAITTEVKPLGEFFYAEPYHQQYLAKNPNGYCGIGGTGVSCPIGLKA